jgi:hypothetical protein
VNNGFRIKALNGDTFTEMRIENGRTLTYVYDRSGRLLDVLEEIACYIHSKDVKQIE